MVDRSIPPDSLSSLPLRYVAGLVLAWTLLVVGIVFVQEREVEEMARRQIALLAERLALRDLQFRHWNARYGGVYVPVSGTDQPNPYLAHVAEQNIQTPSGRVLTLINPDQMILQAGGALSADGVVSHLSSLAPIRPENTADAWEADGLRSFARGGAEKSEVFHRNGETYLRYMRPLIVTDDCLGCHFNHGYKVGEVRGGYAITLSIESFRAAAQRHLLLGYAGGVFLWAGGLGAGFLFWRRLLREKREHLQDVAKLNEAEKSIEYLTYYDQVTGLPNRLFFNDALQKALAEKMATERTLAVGVIGIDHYKKLKNSFGLRVGELVLQETVGRMAAVLRPEDTLACLSESRLMLLLPGVGKGEEVTALMGRVRAAMEYPVLIDGQEFFVSVTAGFAVAPEDGDEARLLISNADTAFSRAKSAGRNSFQFYLPTVDRTAVEEITVENSLRRALEREQFEIFYQPQVDARSGRIVGAEALLRWRNPEVGLVSPADFIPLAEESGMILPIGEWILKTACRHAAAWRDELGHPFKISVNISPRQFQQADLVALVDEALSASGLSPASLVLEVTEGSIVHDIERAAALLSELRKRGVRIAIDDFGTGYASLNYLKLFPVDQVKIDKSFVGDLHQKGANNIIVHAVVALGGKLNLELVAEGVETEQQKVFLQELGCHLMQGYYFCRPMESVKFCGFVAALQDETSDYFTWWKEPGKPVVLSQASHGTVL